MKSWKKCLHGYSDGIDDIDHCKFDKAGGNGPPNDDKQSGYIDENQYTAAGNNGQTNQDGSTGQTYNCCNIHMLPS